jgi:hypothetical protein
LVAPLCVRARCFCDPVFTARSFVQLSVYFLLRLGLHIRITLTVNVVAIISAAPITVTNDPKRWMVFVNAAKGESIVLCGLVNKPNPVGVPLLRQLILTSHKRLIYVDANSLELKGTIEWKKKKAIEPLLLLVRLREVRRLRVTCGGSCVTVF